MEAAALPTKQATVEEALRHLVRQDREAQAREDLAGLGRERDLAERRAGVVFGVDSSIWIALPRGHDTAEGNRLRAFRCSFDWHLCRRADALFADDV